MHTESYSCQNIVGIFVTFKFSQPSLASLNFGSAWLSWAHYGLSLECCGIFNHKTWNARPFLHWHQLIRKPWSLARLGLVRYGTSTLGKWKNWCTSRYHTIVQPFSTFALRNKLPRTLCKPVKTKQMHIYQQISNMWQILFVFHKSWLIR